MNRRLTRRQLLIGSAATGAAALIGGSAILIQRREDSDEPEPTPTPSSAAERQPTTDPEPEPTPTLTPDQEAAGSPTPELEETPPETRSPDPTPEPDPDPEVSIQQLVDDAAVGSIVSVPAGIYREEVTIWKPLTLLGAPGAEIRGDDEDGKVVRERWIVGESDYVTIAGFTMRHAGNRVQTGAITNDGYDNWLIRDCVMSHAAGAIVSLIDAENLSLIDCDVSDAGQIGVHGASAYNVIIQNCRIHHNHSGNYDPAWEAGGLKFTRTVRLFVTGCDVHDNDGPGLWTDIDCDDTTFSYNRVHHNASYGINNEVSGSCQIYRNAVYENGHGYPDWALGAGILVQNSRFTEVFDNVVAWNADGISVVSQDRSSDWRDWNYPSNNNVYDNVMCLVETGAADTYGLAWIQDWDGGIDDPDRNNRGSGNRYYHANPPGSNRPFVYGSSAFEWDDLDGFNDTDGESNGRYLSDREKDEILSSAGIPNEPESRS